MMDPREQKYNFKWLIVLIPLVGLIIMAVFSKNTDETYSQPTYIMALHTIMITAGLWLGCMAIVDFLWKKFPWEQFPVKHLLWEIPLIFIYTLLFSWGLYHLELALGFIQEPADDIYIEAVITLLITYLITAIHEAAEFYKQWKYNFSRSVRLEKDNIEARYETLKQQINPHFLFNSLNSLTNMVEENPRAVAYIQDLSDFLRYGLKSRDRELVLVRDEVGVLQKYISLQKSRFEENLIIEVIVPESLYHYTVPPLVLQMLVENCIKHNIISKDKPLCIKIRAEKNRIFIENNLQKRNNPESTGNGLRNISDRYRFFTTEDVEVSETKTVFKVSIPLLLTEL